MLRLNLLAFLFCICCSAIARGQDYSNRGLIDIKEKSESLRINWIKAFDDAVQSKNFTSLRPIREENEAFLDKHMSMFRRLYADGDGRALLSAVNNYMQIERQFVKDVMVPAESLTPANQEGIDRIYQKIDDFGQKEKVFLIDINNALRTERMDAGPEGSGAPQEIQDEEEDRFEPQGSVVEGKPIRKKSKPLPHEQEGQKKNKKKRKALEDEDE